jgi:hypothetical protein
MHFGPQIDVEDNAALAPALWRVLDHILCGNTSTI